MRNRTSNGTGTGAEPDAEMQNKNTKMQITAAKCKTILLKIKLRFWPFTVVGSISNLGAQRFKGHFFYQAAGNARTTNRALLFVSKSWENVPSAPPLSRAILLLLDLVTGAGFNSKAP